MNIKSLEIKLLKSSEIKDGDIIIVKINDTEKSELDKTTIKNLYEKITNMIKKQIPIYFFPSDLSFEIIKNSIESTQESLKKTQDNE